MSDLDGADRNTFIHTAWSLLGMLKGFPAPDRVITRVSKHQGWAQGSFVEAEARQGRSRELEAEARQTKFEARPRRGDPLKNPPSPRCIAVPNLVTLSQTV